jgi:ribonuclease P protein component
MVKYKFPKSAKLASKSDFRRVFDYKLFAKNDLMTLYIAPNPAGKPRFAVSISAKIRPAVSRNRLKRLAREAFRLSQYEIHNGFDYLIVYSSSLSKMEKSDIRKLTLHQVRQGFMELAEKGYEKWLKRQ